MTVDIIDEVGLWLQFFWIIAAMSIHLWKDSQVGRWAREIFVVGTYASFFTGAYRQLFLNVGPGIMGGDWILLIPVILGALMVTLYHKPSHHLARLGTAVLVGTGTGLAFRGQVESQVIGLAKGMMNNFMGATTGLDIFNAVWIIVTAILVIFYFTFTLHGKPGTAQRTAIDYLRLGGRYLLMFYFGATMANALASYSTLLGNRFIILMERFGF
jgi:hypothetical protein